MQQNTVQRNSFSRPNRPGNLTISDLNEPSSSQTSQASPIQHHLQQQQQQSPYIHQQPQYAMSQQQQPNTANSNTYTNTSFNNNANQQQQQPLLSPHYQQPLRSPHVVVNQQQQAYNRVSPSNNNSYLASPSAVNANTGSNTYQQQQYSPSCNLAPPPPPPPLQQAPTMANGGMASSLPMMTTSSNQQQQQQQSYTPKFPPIASSAHLVNKQPQYFSFDQQHINSFNAPQSSTNTNMVSSPGHYTAGNNQQQQQYMVPHSPLPSNQQQVVKPPLQPPASPHFNSQQQLSSFQSHQFHQFNSNNNNNQQHNHSHYYSHMPTTPTPASALPILTSTPSNYHINNKYAQQSSQYNTGGQMSNHGLQHSMSVPSSPHINHQNNQNSVFKFSTNHINMALQGNMTPTVVRNYQQQQQQSDNSMSSLNMPQQRSKQNSFEFETSEVVVNGGGNAQGSVVVVNDDQSEKSTKDDASLVTTKTYSEKDIEMVSEVFQDIMQNEDQNSSAVNSSNNNNNNSQYNMDPSCSTTASNAATNSVTNDDNLLSSGLVDDDDDDASASVSAMVDEQSHMPIMGSLGHLADENDGGQVNKNNASNGVVVNVSAISTSHGVEVPAQISLVNDNNNNNNNSYDHRMGIVIDSSSAASLINTSSNQLMVPVVNSHESSAVSAGRSNTSTTTNAEVGGLMMPQQQQQAMMLNNDGITSNNVNRHSSNQMMTGLGKPSKGGVVNLPSQSTSKLAKQQQQQQSRMNNRNNSRPAMSSMSDENNSNNNFLGQYQHHQPESNMGGMARSRENSLKANVVRKFEIDSPSMAYNYGGVGDMDSGLNSLDASLLDQNSNSQQSHDAQSDYMSMLSGGGGGGAGSIQKCPDCHKEFTNKSALAKHRLIHSNERKYSCHLCDKSFKRQDHLNGHMMTHQDKKPFECKAPACDKSYCDSRSLKRHVESQHQDYLASLATGNSEALNYLPSIGKIKANLAPNLQQEIIVQDGACVNSYINVIGMDGQANQASSIALGGGGLLPFAPAEPSSLNPGRPKNFFTFEEPKPEKCKICGKGFKNIPALNGHMRLHGGVVKQPSSRSGTGSINGENLNDDSNSSNSMSSSNTAHSYSTTAPYQAASFQPQQQPAAAMNHRPPPVNENKSGAETGFFEIFKTIYEKNKSQMPKPANSPYGAGGLSDSPATNDDILLSKQLSAMKHNNLGVSSSSKHHRKPSAAAMYGDYGDPSNSGAAQQQYGPSANPTTTAAAAAFLTHSFNAKNYSDQRQSSQQQYAGSIFDHFNNPSSVPSASLFPSSLNAAKMPPNESSENEVHMGFAANKPSSRAAMKREAAYPDELVNSSSANFNHSSHSESHPTSQKKTPMASSNASSSGQKPARTDQWSAGGGGQTSLPPMVEAGGGSDNNNNNNNNNNAGMGHYNSYDEHKMKDNSESQRNRPPRPSLESSPSKKARLNENVVYTAPSEFNSTVVDNVFQRSHSSIEPRVSDQLMRFTTAVLQHAAAGHASHNGANDNKQSAVFSEPRKDYDFETPMTIMASNQESGANLSGAGGGNNNNNNSSSSAKQKPKPVPLTIPDQINSFQQATNAMAHWFPSILKSPRFNNELKKQYTPPPMLSPFRKGPGLFCKLLSMYPIPPLYNRTASGSTALPPLFTSYMSSPTPYTKPPIAVIEPPSHSLLNDSKTAPNEKADQTTAVNSAQSSGFTPRPSLLRQRLVSQSSNPGTFFPDTNKDDSASVVSEESLLSSFNMADPKPFVNEGADYQAAIPRWRGPSDREKEKIELKEDLMWDHRVLDKIPSSQFDEYLKLICKSTMVYGSSNNMELGLHILSYYGDIKQAIKPFLDNTIELPKDHPISDYKYPETDIWSEKEIKVFEEALLKYDKCFPDVAQEVKTKTIKQCIEFYYLWKKIKSDTMKKKWKKVKRRHHNDANFEPSNLRSHSAALNNTTTNDEDETAVVAEQQSSRKRPKTAANGNVTTTTTSENMKHNHHHHEGGLLTNGGGGGGVGGDMTYHHEQQHHVGKHLSSYNTDQYQQDNHESLNEIKNQEKYECVKCNLSFRTNQKLKYHINLKHS